MKSFQRKDGSGSPPGGGRTGERDVRKQKRWNHTHASTTDPDARLATGTAERDAATQFSTDLPQGTTLGADTTDAAAAFVEGLKARGVVPHIAIQGSLGKTGRRPRPAQASRTGQGEGRIRLRLRRRRHRPFAEVARIDRRRASCGLNKAGKRRCASASSAKMTSSGRTKTPAVKTAARR